MEFRLFLRTVGSLKFAAVILVLLCVAMACATVYEAMHGTPAALIVFYKSTWFEGLLGLLGLNVLASMLARFPWSRRHVGFLVTHLSIIAILLGAWVSQQFGEDGHLSIVQGEAANELTTDQDALNLRKAGDPASSQAMDLGSGIGGIRAISRPMPEPTLLGDVQVVIDAYLPDSREAEVVVDDNAKAQTALEVSLFGADRRSTEWVFADQASPEDLPVSLRMVADAAAVEAFLKGPASRPSAVKTVKVQAAGKTAEVALARAMAGPVPAGDTGLSIRVIRYLPHAQVGENRQMVNASDRPENPAIEYEVTGPGGSSHGFAFAKFPEFGSMHSATSAPAAEAKVTLQVPADEAAEAAIQMVAAPDGRMGCRFAPPAGEPISREIQVGKPVETPWPGLQFAVLRRLDHARREPTAEAVSPPGEDRVSAIQVSLRRGADNRTVWLRKHDKGRRVTLGDAQYELAYRDKRVPLGFSVRLDQFQVGRYPGSGQPRTFESRVTFIEPGGGEQARVISMNNPARFGRYSFFQSSYNQNQNGPPTSVLSVSWDPGQPIVFASYITLIVGMLYVLGVRMKERRAAAQPAKTVGINLPKSSKTGPKRP
jgi:hypothetical protein